MKYSHSSSIMLPSPLLVLYVTTDHLHMCAAPPFSPPCSPDPEVGEGERVRVLRRGGDRVGGERGPSGRCQVLLGSALPVERIHHRAGSGGRAPRGIYCCRVVYDVGGVYASLGGGMKESWIQEHVCLDCGFPQVDVFTPPLWTLQVDGSYCCRWWLFDSIQEPVLRVGLHQQCGLSRECVVGTRVFRSRRHRFKRVEGERHR